ncbi:MAG: hypothetical protein JRN12_03435 [Nitrososphaerota archaeon]|nr:hypothetical protein [Nitrososphaerota archaeon]
MVDLEFPKIILLLGSYDPQTKPILVDLKETLEEASVTRSDQVSAWLLDEIEIYRFDLNGRSVFVFAEIYEGGVALSVIDGLQMVDSKDFQGKNKAQVDETVAEYLEEHYAQRAYTKLSLLEKLEELSQSSSLVFLVRDQELTRGGEYIELGFLLTTRPFRLAPSKVHFFKREGITLSEMAWEILNLYKINRHSYADKAFLLREATRITMDSLQFSP